MAEEFEKVSRWLYRSGNYLVSAVSSSEHGRWKVVHRTIPVETVGFAGTLEEALGLAWTDEDLRNGDLTPSHGHDIMVMEDNERKSAMTDTPVFNQCKCYSVVEVTTDDEGSELKIHRSCGLTIPKRRTFKPGHDAKFKSALLKAFRAGEGFTFDDGGSLVTKDPVALAKERGWGHFMTAAKPKAPKVKDVNKPDEDPESTDPREVFAGDRGELDPETLQPTEVAGFHPAKVKVGRWWKEGHIVSETDDEVTVRVIDKKTQPKDYTFPRDSNKLEIG